MSYGRFLTCLMHNWLNKQRFQTLVYWVREWLKRKEVLYIHRRFQENIQRGAQAHRLPDTSIRPQAYRGLGTSPSIPHTACLVTSPSTLNLVTSPSTHSLVTSPSPQNLVTAPSTHSLVTYSLVNYSSSYLSHFPWHPYCSHLPSTQILVTSPLSLLRAYTRRKSFFSTQKYTFRLN
jgi:hypothetical protein